MAGTIKGVTLSGLTVYCQILDSSGQRWDGASFGAYNASTYSTYAIAMTEQGTSGIYTVAFPALITEGIYDIFFYRQAGASVAEGDVVVGVNRFNWDGTDEIAEILAENTNPVLKIATASVRNIYGIITNRSGQFWNVTAFETFTAANYANYAITMAEQGSSGVYIGTFPAALSTSGTYEIIYYLRSSSTPTNGDPAVGVGRLIISASETMTGLQFYEYLLRTFKRTDKETEVYEALTDTIRDLRRRVIFADDETEMSTTDLITTAGDYILDLEDSWGLTISEALVLDGYASYPLTMISKSQFDFFFPNPGVSGSSTGKPRYACKFGDQLFVGPVPDSTLYTYKVNFTEEDAASITEDTTNVPYTRLYREILKEGTLYRLFRDLENNEEMGKWRSLYENDINASVDREEKNRNAVRLTHYRGI